MAEQRMYGTGSLVERPIGSGRWFFRYVVGVDPVTGKLRRKAITIYAKSKRAAQAEATRILSEEKQTSIVTAATFGELLQEWMRFQHSRGRSPTTLNGYQSIIDLYLTPNLGHVSLEKITAHTLDSFYAACTAQGKSPRTVRNIHSVISASLNQAVKWGWISANPAQRATLPEPAPRKVTAPSQDEVRELIIACERRSEILGAFVFLAAVTGCRRGELAALRWNAHVNGTLLISESAYQLSGDQGFKSTKSGRERVIHLDPTINEWLNSWRHRCEAEAREWGVTLKDESFIFSSRPDGASMVRMDVLSHDVQKVARGLGLPHIHLHSLRHFAATELLAAGVNPRVAADVLGHADPAMTLRVYAHASVERQRAATGILARAIPPTTP